MDKTLINLNHCRHYGIPMCDNPHDNNRDLCIEINDDLFIPMGMDGSTCVFIYILPTQCEIQVCKRVVILHEIYYDTSAVHFNVSSVYKYNRYELYA